MDVKIVREECRHVFYTKPTKDARINGISFDLHFAKIVGYDEDGNPHPYIKTIKDYKRPFWITKKGCRNHVDKKEFEDINKLEMFTSRQCDLKESIAKKLDIYVKQKDSISDICNNPFIYGADIPSVSYIKHIINSKNSEPTAYSVAVFDIETNMFSPVNEIFLASISYKHRALLAVNRSFFNNHIPSHLNDEKEIDDYICTKIQEECYKWLKDDLVNRKIKLEICLVDSEIDVVRACIGKAHEWQPDILSGWNVVFDIRKCKEACERAGIDPADIFNDPCVPKSHRKFVIKEGFEQRVTASGRKIPLSEYQRWITFDNPASFEIHDAMRDYKFVRTGQPEQIDYSLDYTLEANIKRKKLKTGSVTTTDGNEWHCQMQRYYPFEYCAYNLFDCISVELLDEKTKDMAYAVPALGGDTIYEKVTSVPRRQTDFYHFLALDNNQVIGTCGNQTPEYLTKCMSLKGWIVMLEPIYMADNGAACLEENRFIKTRIYVACFDIDVTGAYPNNTVVNNASRDTQTKFIISINGIDESIVRKTVLNFSGGAVNSLSIMQDMMAMPTLAQMLATYDKKHRSS